MSSAALVPHRTHKTGTTSFHRWANEHCRRSGHSVGSTCIRVGTLLVRSASRGGASDATGRCLRRRYVLESLLDEWRLDLSEHVGAHVAKAAPRLLVSAEELSLLRYEDGGRVLARLLAPRNLRVAVCLRKPSDFITCSQIQMDRMRRQRATIRPRTPNTGAALLARSLGGHAPDVADRPR